MRAIALTFIAAIAAADFFGVGPRLFTAWDSQSDKGTALFKANSFSSDKNPLTYAYDFLPYCRMEDSNLLSGTGKVNPDNLGEVFWGDAVQTTPYIATMRQDEYCRTVCTRSITNTEATRFQRLIMRGFNANFFFDGLPVVSFNDACLDDPRMDPAECKQRIGVPVGQREQPTPAGRSRFYINNHIQFDIRWHRPAHLSGEQDQYRVVGFYGHALSVDWDAAGGCANTTSVQEAIDKGIKLPLIRAYPNQTLYNTIHWTYSVRWKEENQTSWRTRWDVYLDAADDRPGIHWFAVVNALLMLIFLSGVVALIMLRLLHRDFNVYNDPANAAEGMEETGWKLVHGDVFRRPPSPNILCALTGTGVQLNLMILVTLAIALAGLLTPAKRGATLTVLLLMYFTLGLPAGFVAARMAKMWGIASWSTILLTATFVPSICAVLFVVVNIFMYFRGASNAVGPGALLTVFCLYLALCAPLVFTGAIVGYKLPAIESVTRVKEHPTPIKPLPWYYSSSLALSGFIPFFAGYFEIYFIFNSVWQQRFFYVFGTLTAVFVIVMLVVALLVIVRLYLQLCYEDHRVWWSAFWHGASPAFFLFAYSCYYFTTKLSLSYTMAAIMFFGRMGMLAFLFGVMGGSVGVIACFIFTRIIYGWIPVE